MKRENYQRFAAFTVILFLAFAWMAGEARSQNKQMVVDGVIRIDGAIPPPTAVVRVLRKDLSFVKTATIYDADSARFGVSIFSSEGFGDNDPVLFRIVPTATDSFVARNVGGPVLFVGVEAPNPPPIVEAHLWRNHIPTPARLVQPGNLDTITLSIPAVGVKFAWRKSTDIDAGDTVKYLLRIAGPGLDTLISVNDTVRTLDIMPRLQVASVYKWNVGASDGFETAVADTFSFRTSDKVVGVLTEGEQFPGEFYLEQNFPNPFNPTTIIRYQLAAAGFVSLRVYDVLGRQVATLLNERKDAGRHEAIFDADGLTSGVYFYILRANDVTEARQMVYMR